MDVDTRKIRKIYFEFFINMITNVIHSVHFCELILMRGLNISVFTHFLIGKTAFQAIHKTTSDVSNFMKFRKFM